MAMNTYEYASQKLIAKQERSKKFYFIIGGICLFLGLTGVVMVISGDTSELETSTTTTMTVYLVTAAVGALLAVIGYFKGKQAAAVRRYETIFEGDRDGVVTMKELSGQMGMDADKVFKELEGMFRAGYFSNCSLQRGGEPCVILNDAMRGEAGVGFVEVQCPKCTAMTRIRAGSRGKCSFCGAPIVDKGVTE